VDKSANKKLDFRYKSYNSMGKFHKTILQNNIMLKAIYISNKVIYNVNLMT